MKKTIYTCVVAFMLLVSACSTTNTGIDYDLQKKIIIAETEGLNSELNYLVSSLPYMGINDREPEEVDTSSLSYFTLIELMKANKDNFTYTITGITIDKDSDFYSKSYDDQCEILGNMFIPLGSEEKKVAVEYDYVPTGEKSVTDGEEIDITEYKATQYITTKTLIYSTPLFEIESVK